MAEVKAEFWVMRVVLSSRLASKWRRMADSFGDERLGVPVAVRTAFAAVRAGAYTEAGGMGILEPVEVFDSNVKATQRAIELQRKHPSETFVTVLNADPEELAKDPDADGAMSS